LTQPDLINPRLADAEPKRDAFGGVFLTRQAGAAQEHSARRFVSLPDARGYWRWVTKSFKPTFHKIVCEGFQSWIPFIGRREKKSPGVSKNYSPGAARTDCAFGDGNRNAQTIAPAAAPASWAATNPGTWRCPGEFENYGVSVARGGRIALLMQMNGNSAPGTRVGDWALRFYFWSPLAALVIRWLAVIRNGKG
jgi:hypothetical protein